MEIIYIDEDIVVCVKPARILSTDEPGGMPDLLRQQLGEPKADIRTVHRLDRTTEGLILMALNRKSAAKLSAMVQEHRILSKR